jgi:hypothetical protein
MLHAPIAIALAWTGDILTRKRKSPVASATKQIVRVLLAVLLVGAGLWSADVVTYRMWAAGGRHPMHESTQVYWIVGGLVLACAFCFTAGVAWPRRRKA